MAGPHWEFEGPALLAPPPASLQAVRATCHPPDLPRWLGRASGLHLPTPPGDTDTAPACLGPSDRWSVSTCVPRHLLPRGPLPAGSDGSHRNAIIPRLDRRYPARPAPSTTVWSADGAVAGQLESPCPRTSLMLAHGGLARISSPPRGLSLAGRSSPTGLWSSNYGDGRGVDGNLTGYGRGSHRRGRRVKR